MHDIMHIHKIMRGERAIGYDALFPKSDGLHVPDIVWVSNGMMFFLKQNVRFWSVQSNSDN